MCATISASFTLSHRLFEDQSEHDECFCRNNGRANGLREYVPESDVFDKYIEKDGIDPQVYKCNGKVERELHRDLGVIGALENPVFLHQEIEHKGNDESCDR